MKYISVILLVILCSSMSLFSAPAITTARCPDTIPKYVEGMPIEYFGDFYLAACRYDIEISLLAGLARTESGFDPTAISLDGHDRGMFQLRDKYDVERGIRDPFDYVESVNQAAKLLFGHYKYFGDWTLAIAAYRQGRRGVENYGPDMWYVNRVLQK